MQSRLARANLKNSLLMLILLILDFKTYQYNGAMVNKTQPASGFAAFLQVLQVSNDEDPTHLKTIDHPL